MTVKIPPVWKAVQGASRNQFARDVIVLYFITFVLVLPIVCFKMRNSLFYGYDNDILKEDMIMENSERTKQADHYFRTMNPGRLKTIMKTDTISEVDVLFTIISASRDSNRDHYKPRYLKQVVWKLISTLESTRRRGFNRTVGILVCNVDVRWPAYEDVKNVSAYASIHHRFASSTQRTVRSRDLKHRHDYVYCMNTSLKHTPNYLVMVEDDALPHDDMYLVMDNIIRTQIERRKVGETYVVNEDPPLFVKFYHPERLISYLDIGRDRIPELAGFAVFFGTVAIFIYTKFLRPKCDISLLAKWCVFVIYFAMVAVTVGRANVISLKTYFSPHLYTYVPAAECCTQAVIFPRLSAQDMVRYLHTADYDVKWPNDRVMHAVVQTHRRRAYMVLPNLYTHIGLYSSLRNNKKVNPYVI